MCVCVCAHEYVYYYSIYEIYNSVFRSNLIY